MAKLEIRAKARDDLRSIRSWIAKDNPVRARSFIVELNLHFQKIADQHLRHPVIADLGPDVRRAVHGSYNIYYRFIGDDLKDVQIIRVMNAALSLEGISLE